MNVVVDIGNTSLKLALFKKGKLVLKQVLQKWTEADIIAFLTNQNAQNLILSNVAQSLSEVSIAHLQEECFCVFLDEKTPLPIQNLYETPHTLGKDRLAAAVGAYALFPGRDALVIDAGTCITYEFLSAAGQYRGGNIAPGLRMRLEAMHTFTKRLPWLEIEETGEGVGRNTKTAMQIGAQRGMTFEMMGYIEEFRKKNRNAIVILTGGDAIFFAKKLKNEIFVDQNLVLFGLDKILEYNVSLLQ